MTVRFLRARLLAIVQTQVHGAGVPKARCIARDSRVPLRGSEDSFCQRYRLSSQWGLLSMSTVRPSQRQHLQTQWVSACTVTDRSGFSCQSRCSSQLVCYMASMLWFHFLPFLVPYKKNYMFYPCLFSFLLTSVFNHFIVFSIFL